MVKAVIFDFGGVFTTSPFEAFARFEDERSLPTDFIRNVNASNYENNAWARFERAELTLAEFDEAFANESRALGHEVRGRDIMPLLKGDLRPAMVTALSRIHAVMKTGCITNNVPANKIGSDDGRSIYVSEVMTLFHHVIESAKVGIRKPDPRIYAMMISALDVDAGECIYLDDLGINLKPARAMGMATIKVINGAQAILELATLTGIDLA